MALSHPSSDRNPMQQQTRRRRREIRHRQSGGKSGKRRTLSGSLSAEFSYMPTFCHGWKHV